MASFEQVAGVPEALQIESGIPGPRVTIFSGVHGDEISGVHAVDRLFFDLFSGLRTLKCGSLILAKGNQEAFAVRKRYIRFNLNRLFRDSYDPSIDTSSYEYQRAQQLKPLLENRDYVLDLHSAPIAQEPFLFAEEEQAKFYTQLGIERVVIGWSDLPGEDIQGSAETWGRLHGALSATVEAGSHFDVASLDVSYRSAVQLLRLLSMVDPLSSDPEVTGKGKIFRLYEVVHKETPDFHYVPSAENFRHIESGETYAATKGKEFKAAEDTYLICPMAVEDSKVGEEIGYLGRLESR